MIVINHGTVEQVDNRDINTTWITTKEGAKVELDIEFLLWVTLNAIQNAK
jgi:hypothetical protein